MDPSYPNFPQPNNSSQPTSPNQQNPNMQINFDMSSTLPIPSYFHPMHNMPYQSNMNYMPYGQTPQPYGYVSMPSMGMHDPNTNITNYPGYYTQQIPEVVVADSSEYQEPETPPTQRARGSRSYNSWSNEHNKVFLTGWLRYTNDSVTGTSQTSGTYWDAITTFVNENLPNGPQRTSKHYRSSGSKRGHDSEGGEMSTSNVQCQRPQGRDAAKRSKGKSSKASKIEAIERVVECHDDYMTFRKKELERYEAMEVARKHELE
ncbi:hypothetical protein LIER_09586 [Lithospermum erythrorhizon]|uniref:No apical meristem-associated C-terminal domain-containing protein n=1 Tax=Lithospermum erythrorhizon TaxID=34254 RepID=A0AAV3PKH8_LITER